MRKDGSLVDVSVTFSPILTGPHALIGISGDLARHHAAGRAAHEIAEREERIRLLLDSTAEAIYGIDLNGACIFCNAACARLLGYESPAALIGKQMHPLIHHTQAGRHARTPPEQSPIYEAMRHREGGARGRRGVVAGGRHVVPGGVLEPSDLPQRRGDRRGGDVPRHHRARKAEREIQEGVRRREQFLAMLSHELRNPLAAILSATRLLDRANWSDGACHEAGQVVERQAKHMTRLLDDLLDVSRITRGRITLRTEPVDLRDTARSAIEALGPADRRTRHDPHRRISRMNLLLVVGDPARLQQVQANLLSNASKYSTARTRVRFELRRVDGDAMIRVADSGRGIEPQCCRGSSTCSCRVNSRWHAPRAGWALG